jgi:hypothetical protein
MNGIKTRGAHPATAAGGCDRQFHIHGDPAAFPAAEQSAAGVCGARFNFGAFRLKEGLPGYLGNVSF